MGPCRLPVPTRGHSRADITPDVLVSYLESEVVLLALSYLPTVDQRYIRIATVETMNETYQIRRVYLEKSRPLPPCSLQQPDNPIKLLHIVIALC